VEADMVDDIGLTQKSAGESQRATKHEKPAAAAIGSAPSTTVARDTLAIGTKVGRYEIVRLVGQGGMGTVYEALDARLGRRVALKVLAPELKCKRKAAKRFAIEAQAAARLVHPNVVGIYDFDMACAIPYMAMEFLEGQTLAAEIAAGPLAFERLADIMLAVCAGVHAAHRAGIVHRDLKPSNIFLCPDWTGHPTARVLDFGISKVVGLVGSGITDTGDIVGTSQYLSPEQAAGARQIDEASDQYSLGVVMYEMATQRTPQHGQPIHVLLVNVTQGRHTPVRELRPDLPAALETVLARAMSLRPKARFPSVHALGQALFPLASADVQRQFHDYYRGAGDSSGSNRSAAAASSSSSEIAPTVREDDTPIAAWRDKPTRTSLRRRVGEIGDAARSEPGAHKPRAALYSIAVGAAVAALALVAVFLVLRP
jgi:serine/threonine protein kinase